MCQYYKIIIIIKSSNSTDENQFNINIKNQKNFIIYEKISIFYYILHNNIL